MADRTLLDIFDVSLEFLTRVVADNPSLRGMLLGYVAEAKLRVILHGHGRASAFRKDDDHDRKKKGDLVVTYQGIEFKIEVKSLQTNTVELLNPADGTWSRKMLKRSGRGQENLEYVPLWEQIRIAGQYRGQFQCDASDRRKVQFENGSTLETTNLVVGEFHVLAAGLFAFREKWDFAFALNRDLPRSTNPAYTKYQRDRLIKGLIAVTWPVAAPFVTDIYALLDQLVAEEKAKQAGQPAPQAPAVVELPPVQKTKPVEEARIKVVEKKPKKKS